VITGEEPEAAGVDLETLREAELGTEIGGEERLAGLIDGVRPALGEPARGVELSVELLPGGGSLSDEVWIGGEFCEARLPHFREQLDGIVLGSFPESGIDGVKDTGCIGVPCPGKVEGEVDEWTQGRRDMSKRRGRAKRLWEMVGHEEKRVWSQAWKGRRGVGGKKVEREGLEIERLN